MLIISALIKDTIKKHYLKKHNANNANEQSTEKSSEITCSSDDNLSIDNIMQTFLHDENETKITLTAEKKKPLVNLIGKQKYDDIEIKISFKKFEKPIVDSGQETKIEESIRRILKKTNTKGYY